MALCPGRALRASTISSNDKCQSVCYLLTMGKPLVTIRADSDIYQLFLSAVIALRQVGLQDQAYELLRRGQAVASHLHMLDLVAEFVELQQDRSVTTLAEKATDPAR